MAKPDYAGMVKQLNLPSQAVLDAIDDLNAWVCLHPKFIAAQQEIMSAISGRSRDLLIVVLGPARAGKTTLLESIAGMSDALALERGQRRGCFRFSVPPPDYRGRFNWSEAIIEAYLETDEPLPFNKIEYGDIEDGAAKGRSGQRSTTATDAGLWHSFVKNIKLEKLAIIVDEGNTIPVILGDLQVNRAIHSFKYIVKQTEQPLIIGGTSNIKRIVEHDVQFKVRTKVVRLDAYDQSDVDIEGFRTFLEELEARLGSTYCEQGCLATHAEEIRTAVDGRPGLAVRIATDVLSGVIRNPRLTWNRYKRHLDAMSDAALEDLKVERHITSQRIVAAAEARAPKKAKSEQPARSGRVGATKNSNSPNHPYE